MKKSIRLIAALALAAAAAFAGRIVTEKVKEGLEEPEEFTDLDVFEEDMDEIQEEEPAVVEEPVEEDVVAEPENEETAAEIDIDIQDEIPEEEPVEEEEAPEPEAEPEEEEAEPEEEIAEEDPEPVEEENGFLGDWQWTKMMINDDIMNVGSVYGDVVTHINGDGTVFNNDVKVGIWKLRENDLVVVADPEDEGEAMATVDGEHIAMCGFDEDNNLIMVATMEDEDQVGKIMCTKVE